MYDDYDNEEEMTPEEESFPVENNSPRKSLIDSAKQAAMKKGSSSKDGQKLQDTIAKNKGKNGGANFLKDMSKKKANSGDGESEGEEGKENKLNPAEDAAKQAAIEAAKQAAATALQAYGVPADVTKKILDKATETEEFQKLVDETIEKYKKIKRRATIITIICVVLPILVQIIPIVFVAAIVMLQTDAVVSRIDSALTVTSTTAEKLLNFTAGDGWQTNEEKFFKTLKDEYKISLNYSEEGLDIALLASTIHYEYIGDVSLFEKDNSEQTDTTLDSDTAMFENFLDQQNLKNFYYVASDKLGAIGNVAFGQRKLIGHMYDVKFSMKKYSFYEALELWIKFFQYYGKVVDESVIKQIFKTPAQLRQQINTMFAYEEGNQDNYFEYKYRNNRYEYQEFLDNIDALFGKNGENIDSPQLTDATTEEQKSSGIWPAPTIEFIYDEDKYYEYLKAVYIPGTYFSDDNYDEVEVERIVREIFQQRDMYHYLFGTDGLREQAEGCRYNYGSAVNADVNLSSYNIDATFINNLMVEVYDGSCGKKLSDCQDSDITHTIPFEDYVIGVAYSEIGASLGDNEEWLKANMVAIKSYTLGKNPGSIRKYGDKFYIKMLNNTYQQTFCDTSTGCLERSSNRKPALTEEAINYLKGVYQKVKNDFLYSESSGFVGSYRSDYSLCVSAGITGMCLGQNDSEEDAASGLDYQSILGKYYTVDVGLFDASTSALKTAVYQCYSPGLVAGNYSNYSIRAARPVSTDVYYKQPYVSNSNRGQCVWYVKGRASEILSTTVNDKEVLNTVLAVLKNATGNGNQWYNEALQSVFGSSTDYTKPKRGSIAVYDWNDQRCLSYWNRYGSNYCKARYGHAIIIEEVNEENQTVTITDGWTNTGSCPNNWDCVQFRSRSDIPISDLNNLNTLGGGFKFIGYIYLLD